MTAVVAIRDISPSKSSTKAQHSNSDPNNRSESEVEVPNNKQSTRLSEPNKEILDTNLLNSENVNDLLHSAENFVNKDCEENGLVDSSHKEILQKGAKKCLFDQSDLKNSAEENVSRPLESKNCVLYEKETERESNVTLNSETEIDSGSVNNTIDRDSKLHTTECERIPAKHSQGERKLPDEADHFGSSSDNTEQYLPVTSEEFSAKEADFSCEGKATHSTADRNTENHHSVDTKSIPSLIDNASPCKEALKLLSTDNSFSRQLCVNEKKAVSLSTDPTMEESKTDVRGIKTDKVETICQEQSDSETQNMNEKMEIAVANSERMPEDPLSVINKGDGEIITV